MKGFTAVEVLFALWILFFCSAVVGFVYVIGHFAVKIW
jgi:hypothetical protein